MNMLARSSLLVVALLAAGAALDSASARADAFPKDTNTIERLTPEQARELVDDFPGVDVEVEAIKGFGKRVLFRCLPLNGLKLLDAETAQALADYRKGPLVLSGLTTLDAAAAKGLAEFKGRGLFLNGLTTLDADTGKPLAEFKGDELGLDGLTTLDAATANALAVFKGHWLSLNGLTALDGDTAKSIAGYQGNLFLNGLPRLDADAARPLAGFKGHVLWLKGLTTLDIETARALEGFGRGLALPDEVRTAFLADNPLTTETALVWAVVANGNLSRVTTLDADTAKALAEFKGGQLHLGGLTTLDTDAAKALAMFEGRLDLPRIARNAFLADNPLAAETARAWALVLDGDLSRVTALDTPDSIAIARALATRKGPLALPNLKKISPKTLTALIEKRDVVIPLIETLEFIPEPDGSGSDDFVIPEWLEERQDEQRRQKGRR